MRFRDLMFAAALATPLVAIPTMASAQEYGGTGATTTDTGDRGDEVLGATFERPAVEAGNVSPASVARTAPVSGGLAVTGSDVAGLAILGVSLVGGGAVLVRRTRRPALVSAT